MATVELGEKQQWEVICVVGYKKHKVQDFLCLKYVDCCT